MQIEHGKKPSSGTEALRQIPELGCSPKGL